LIRIQSFTTRRRQGNAREPGALERLLRTRKWPTAVATAEQVHGTRLAIVPALRHSRKFAGVDGLLTDQSDQPLAIFTADCVPVFLTDEGHRVVGLLHAGWRGIRAGILAQAVRKIRRRWGILPRKLRIWTGPSSGPCCFGVQWDVARHFPRSRKRARDSWRVDLAGELRFQARRLGVRFFDTPGPASCTMHDRRFYSYRRDQTAKRMASVIMRTVGADGCPP
jgi:hypothetical protein